MRRNKTNCSKCGCASTKCDCNSNPCKTEPACNPDPTGCEAIKSPYYIQVCKDPKNCKGCKKNNCKAKKVCRPTTSEDGINIFVRDVGTCVQGTVVFLHGQSTSGSLFAYQINNLANRGFRVIAIDMRGFGQSDQPFEPYDYDVFADDLRQILDCLDVQDVTLVGFSLGGGVALHYVARHCCCRVAKLVLTGSASINLAGAYPPALFQQLLANSLVDFPATLNFAFQLSFFPFAPSPETLGWVLNIGLEGSLWSGYNALASSLDSVIAGAPLVADMAKVCVPTLILHGVQDLIVPFANAVQLNAGIAGSVLVPFNSSGHFLMFSEQQLYNDQIAAFAAGVGCGPCSPTPPPFPPPTPPSPPSIGLAAARALAASAVVVSWDPVEGPTIKGADGSLSTYVRSNGSLVLTKKG